MRQPTQKYSQKRVQFSKLTQVLRIAGVSENRAQFSKLPQVPRIAGVLRTGGVLATFRRLLLRFSQYSVEGTYLTRSWR